MSKINIYVGLNIQDLKFQCGAPEMFEGTEYIAKGVVHYTADGTHRHLIEAGLHPQKIAERVVSEVNYCYGSWDLHISTHSDVPLNVLGLMLHHNVVKAEDLQVFVMSDDNQSVSVKSVYDEKGFLVNWPYGFMDFNYTPAVKEPVSQP